MRTSELLAYLVCPGCRGRLRFEHPWLYCEAAECKARPKRWPIVNGKPILIDDTQSLVKVESFSSDWQTYRRQPRISTFIRRLTPDLSRNVRADRNARSLGEMLDTLGYTGNVLVLGCGDGSSAARIVSRYTVRLINVDIRLTQEVDVVCDGHNLPFPSGTFDAVFIQGVLEHVLRPQVIADEVFRVLRDKGMIYCEFPFMQPTHGAAFDFSRLTFTGHRMLWRRFVEIDSGACCGPGMALAHSIQQFARSLLPGRASRFAAEIVAGWCFWWLKYLDEWLVKTPAGLDGASAYYFLGRKTEEELSDAEVIKSYRGAQR